jgi:hypothetical protein
VHLILIVRKKKEIPLFAELLSLPSDIEQADELNVWGN